MLKLLIADGTEAFRLALAENLKDQYIIRVCQEGYEALAMMAAFKPELMVVDLLLPGLDGITVLQRAAASGAEPVALATTGYFNEYISDAISRLNVGYVMMKPCDVQAAASHLQDLAERMKAPTLAQPDDRTVVSNLLLAMGFATNLRGYAYLRDCVLSEIRNPGQQVTKTLYPDVGKCYGATGAQVERAIRSAIEKAWARSNSGLWRQLFPDDDSKPSNGAFISAMADRVVNSQRRDSGCRAG